jgi:hypothetical protein
MKATSHSKWELLARLPPTARCCLLGALLHDMVGLATRQSSASALQQRDMNADLFLFRSSEVCDWGFMRAMHGYDFGSYYDERFLCGMNHLCEMTTRLTSKDATYFLNSCWQLVWKARFF